ncbi:LOW QUALITY PROTEIN: hypothetical protein FGSG_13327 [Fusarium graminearum PH-1]|uniref:hypothetical protein n=1 Tax=Gibberella zeae (strain ATCC MYA-4620 / CBS 123657 / FGSC 9075 / NRRL 31084 / PH-1) TaxID=229533 RepID=UPI00021F18AE|nr:LOW QUALITY PROTEIN: hypothetical protein FGSG_13327 [Fusarium graminearum PH-1]ESU14685.1 LOW QUALITY PROTEIN: hypothetical protein FGSG_13327 [Fusarium graminearum PH-1]|eukprot:XP_011320110.1 LOW QUALITY PROTEIN: hypothetical protein FGSG_13327 [Fusarium graminearum PH-1]
MKDTTPRGNIRNDTHSNTVSNVFRILDTEYPQNAGRKTLSVFLLQPLRELGETLASVFPSYCNGLRVRMRLAFWRERTFRILEPHENLPTMQVIGSFAVMGRSYIGVGSLPTPTYPSLQNMREKTIGLQDHDVGPET